MSLYERCDFHIHTRLSGCARSEMRLPAILRVCKSRGIEYLGITDHVFPSTDPGILEVTRREVDSLDGQVKVFLGCEADIVAAGEHTVTAAMISMLDFVMVSANHYHVPWVSQPPGNSPRVIAEHYLSMFAYACSLQWADVIAHPLCAMSEAHDPACLDLLKDEELLRAVNLAKANRIAMEISPRTLASGNADFQFRFYSLCRQAGVKFSVGSDAHSLAHAGQTAVLTPLVEKLGITDDDIWLPDKTLRRDRIDA